MKRLCWLELAVIMSGFWLVISEKEEMAIILLAMSLAGLYLVIDKWNYYSFFIAFGISLLLMTVIANGGQLSQIYDRLDLIIVLLAVNLGLLSEYLDHRGSLDILIKPFFTYLVIGTIFIVGLFALNDLSILNLIYPAGFISLLSLVMIIFVPYLMIASLLLLFHEYNI